MAVYFALLLNIIFSVFFGATAQNLAYYSGQTSIPALPNSSLSPFANFLYNDLTTRNILSRLFDVSFSPSDVASDFFSASSSFAQSFGVNEPGVFPQMVSETLSHAIEGLAPEKYFLAASNSIEKFLKNSGLLTLDNQEQLVHSYATFLQDAVESIGLTGPQAGLRALSEGSVNFLKSLGQFAPDQITYLMSTFVDEISRV